MQGRAADTGRDRAGGGYAGRRSQAPRQQKHSVKVPLLEFQHLCFDWHAKKSVADQQYMLHDLSLKIHRTERIGILGKTGLGKSSLSYLLCGRVSPLSGQLMYRGQPCSYPAYRKAVSLQCQLLPQHPLLGFNPRLSIMRSILDAFVLYRKLMPAIPRKEARERFLQDCDSLCAQMDIPTALLQRHPNECSGGQLQRLSLLRAFIVRPQLLILDEPVSFLDLMLRKRILDIVLEYHASHSSAIVLISHLPEVLQYFAETVYELKEGVLHRKRLQNERRARGKRGGHKALNRTKNWQHSGRKEREKRED